MHSFKSFFFREILFEIAACALLMLLTNQEKGGEREKRGNVFKRKQTGEKISGEFCLSLLSFQFGYFGRNYCGFSSQTKQATHPMQEKKKVNILFTQHMNGQKYRKKTFLFSLSPLE